MKLLTVIAMSFLLSACGATIQSHRAYSIPIGVMQTASIGTELYRVTKQRDLPNAFGKADIFGGKINTGYSELRFVGLDPKGNVIFRFTDVNIESNETTFSRYGVSSTAVDSHTTANALMTGNLIHGTANTRTMITHHDKPEATVTQLPPNTVEFVFDPEEERLVLADISIQVISVNNYSITYALYR